MTNWIERLEEESGQYDRDCQEGAEQYDREVQHQAAERDRELEENFKDC